MKLGTMKFARRCNKCGAVLFKICSDVKGTIEIKCHKCKAIITFGNPAINKPTDRRCPVCGWIVLKAHGNAQGSLEIKCTRCHSISDIRLDNLIRQKTG